MPRREKKSVLGLGPVESRIMEILWARGEAGVRQVAGLLTGDKQPAYTTVMTIMSRLAEKGLLQRRLAGKAYIYKPAKTRNQFIADVSRAEVRELVRDFGDVALAHFAQELEQASPEKLEQLRTFLKTAQRDAQ